MYHVGMANKCAVAKAGQWCGLCYSGLKGRGVFPGHAGWSKPRGPWRSKWMALKRVVRSPAGAPGLRLPTLDCELSVLFPTVLEFLSLSAWEDGTARLPGTITLLTDGTMIKAALNDRDAELSCFVSGRTLTELLTTVEAGLSAGSLDWREKVQWKGPRRGRGG